MIQPKPSNPPPSRPRVAPHATRRRRLHARRARYAGSVRVLGLITLILAAVMSYVALTSNVTGLNYAIAHAENERVQLQGDVQRLDDQIAHLESRERLAEVAAKLKMRDPARYEIVALPQTQPRPKPGGIALLGWFRGGR